MRALVKFVAVFLSFLNDVTYLRIMYFLEMGKIQE